MRRILFILMVTLGIGYVGISGAATEEESKGRGDTEEDKENKEWMLSEIGWRSYAGFPGLAPGDGLLEEDFKDVVKKFLKHDGESTKACSELGKEEPWAFTNTLVVRVFYRRADGRIYHKKIPHIFLSGWDGSGKGLGNRKEEVDLAQRYFGGEMTQKFIGDYYLTGRGPGLSLPEAKSIKNLAGADKALFKDFGNRFCFNPEVREERVRILKKKSGGAKRIYFWNDAYAHSEQAFISYVQNDPFSQVDEIVPSGVILYFMSTNDPCSNCDEMIKNLIRDEEFRKSILERMFPGSVAHAVPLNVIYGSYHEFGTGLGKVKSPGDLIDSLDFTQKRYYVGIRE